MRIVEKIPELDCTWLMNSIHTISVFTFLNSFCDFTSERMLINKMCIEKMLNLNHTRLMSYPRTISVFHFSRNFCAFTSDRMLINKMCLIYNDDVLFFAVYDNFKFSEIWQVIRI